MNSDLIKLETQLPDTIQDLGKFILLGEKVVDSQNKILEGLKEAGICNEFYEAKKKDGQTAAELVVDADVKLGTLLAAIPDFHSSGKGTMKRKSLPDGVDKKRSHKAQAAKNNPDCVEEAKKEAKKKDILVTTRDVDKKIKQKKKKKKTEQLKEEISAQPEGLFDVIIIDPPWKYGTKYDPETRRCASPYPEMSLEELEQMELPAADNCVLWLWSTHKFIFDAKNLLEKWGFEYKTTLVWNKEKLGLGGWLRNQIEFCLLGIKGKPIWTLSNERDFISEARREHSRKPEKFYSIVKDLCYGRVAEYFSREERDGIEPFGNETKKFGDNNEV